MPNISLKQILNSILIAITTLAAGSCCTKKMCIGADNMDLIRFDNFSNSELDTIVIQRFSRNTNFATVIDNTTIITSNFSAGAAFQQIVLPTRLTTDFDYKVKMISTGKDYKISDFVTKMKGCNTGFMCNDSYNALESYKVNGTLKSSYQLEISQ